MSITGTGQVITYHPPEQCDGQPCPMHNPSGHHMAAWPLHLRVDRPPLMERTCPHDVGHPDPDSAAYLTRLAPLGVWHYHGCDGCCAVQTLDAASI